LVSALHQRFLVTAICIRFSESVCILSLYAVLVCCFADKQNLELIAEFKMGESVTKVDKDNNGIELQTIDEVT
jgi:hypothetical protein